MVNSSLDIHYSLDNFSLLSVDHIFSWLLSHHPRSWSLLTDVNSHGLASAESWFGVDHGTVVTHHEALDLFLASSTSHVIGECSHRVFH